MDTLPTEILDMIYVYIPIETLIILDKKSYIKYNSQQRKRIAMYKYDSYVRSMIRNDYSFIIYILIQENYEKWKKNIKYYYKNKKYQTYYLYLMTYSIENESPKCFSVIKENYKTDLKQHKKVHSTKYNGFYRI
tara:strand:- start:379 stop:780 length:402 start_codon:yes stop_codon:yes gene_type:complete